MQIENEDELKDNKPHFVNDPALEQEDDDLDEPGMADTDSLLAETDDIDFEEDDSDLDDAYDGKEDEELDLDSDRDADDEDLD